MENNVYLKKIVKISYLIQLVVILLVGYSAKTNSKFGEYHSQIGMIAGIFIIILLILNIIVNQKIHKNEFERVNSELQENISYIKQKEKQLIDVLNQMKEPVLIFNEDEIKFSNKIFDKLINRLDGNNESRKITKKSIHEQLLVYLSQKREVSGENHLELKASVENGDIIELTAYLSKILWNNKICDYVVIKDVTDEFRELRRSAQFQRSRMKKNFGFIKQIEFKSIYVPYYVVSGDFYYFKPINDHEVIGILGDVMGKGISAALFNSAMLILFEEGLNQNDNPVGILNYINEEIGKYLDENYVAALCFKFNFKSNIVEISSAGINEFIIHKSNDTAVRKINRGPFLGMLQDSNFELYVSEFNKDDELFFYTDGLDPVFSNNEFIAQMTKRDSLEEKMNYLQRTIPISRHKRLDDCTCLGFKMR